MIGLIPIILALSPSGTTPPSKKGLTLLGLGFIYLSMDEGASIHEKITYEFYDNPLVPYFNGTHGIWIVVYGCIGIIMLIILARDIVAVIRNYTPQAIVFMVGMVVFLAGAAGAETITFFYIDKSDPMVYTVEVIVEEFLEMSGASLLLYSVAQIAVKNLEQHNNPKSV